MEDFEKYIQDYERDKTYILSVTGKDIRNEDDFKVFYVSIKYAINFYYRLAATHNQNFRHFRMILKCGTLPGYYADKMFKLNVEDESDEHISSFTSEYRTFMEGFQILTDLINIIGGRYDYEYFCCLYFLNINNRGQENTRQLYDDDLLSLFLLEDYQQNGSSNCSSDEERRENLNFDMFQPIGKKFTDKEINEMLMDSDLEIEEGDDPKLLAKKRGNIYEIVADENFVFDMNNINDLIYKNKLEPINKE